MENEQKSCYFTEWKTNKVQFPIYENDIINLYPEPLYESYDTCLTSFFWCMARTFKDTENDKFVNAVQETWSSMNYEFKVTPFGRKFVDGMAEFLVKNYNYNLLIVHNNTARFYYGDQFEHTMIICPIQETNGTWNNHLITGQSYNNLIDEITFNISNQSLLANKFFEDDGHYRSVIDRTPMTESVWTEIYDSPIFCTDGNLIIRTLQNLGEFQGLNMEEAQMQFFADYRDTFGNSLTLTDKYELLLQYYGYSVTIVCSSKIFRLLSQEDKGDIYLVPLPNGNFLQPKDNMEELIASLEQMERPYEQFELDLEFRSMGNQNIYESLKMTVLSNISPADPRYQSVEKEMAAIQYGNEGINHISHIIISQLQNKVMQMEQKVKFLEEKEKFLLEKEEALENWNQVLQIRADGLIDSEEDTAEWERSVSEREEYNDEYKEKLDKREFDLYQRENEYQHSCEKMQIQKDLLQDRIDEWNQKHIELEREREGFEKFRESEIAYLRENRHQSTNSTQTESTETSSNQMLNLLKAVITEMS